MDIKVKGKIFYQIDNAIAAMLMEAFPESFQRVNPKPAPAPDAFIPSWGVNVTTSGYHHVVFKLGDRTEFYDGPPSGLAAHFQKMGIVVPANILARYTPIWRPRDNEHPAVQDAYWAEYEAIHSKEKK
jgi:hypothetical protein